MCFHRKRVMIMQPCIGLHYVFNVEIRGHRHSARMWLLLFLVKLQSLHNGTNIIHEYKLGVN